MMFAYPGFIETERVKVLDQLNISTQSEIWILASRQMIWGVKHPKLEAVRHGMILA